MRSLTGRVQHYAWGSTDDIPRILGTPPDGAPWAEYWLGAHASAPSALDDPQSGEVGSGDVLDEYLARHGEEIGDVSRATFGERLPYLVKILSAAHSLSLQAHPSRAQAQAGFAAENAAGIPLDVPERLFRDDWPKPEMIVALTDFDALSGFRDPAESLALVAALGPMPLVDQVLEPLRQSDPATGLAAVIRDCLTGSDRVRAALTQLLDAARSYWADGVGPAGEFARTAVDLATDHPGDPSILAALLMNRVRLSPGEQIHQPAGTIHAYLQGTGIEIMANSDNVMRGGLTAKHVDIDALLTIADLEPHPVVPSLAQPCAPGIALYQTPYPEFRLWRLTPSEPVELPDTERGRILLVIEGSLDCSAGNQNLTVTAGGSAWLAAGEKVAICAAPDTLAFLAGPGI